MNIAESKGPELITNGSFETTLSPWLASPVGPGGITRVVSTKTRWGEYVMKIEKADAANLHAYYTVNMGEKLAGKIFWVEFYVYGDTEHDITIEAYSSTENPTITTATVTLTQTKILKEFKFETSTDTSFWLRIFAAEKGTFTPRNIYVDHVSLCEITKLVIGGKEDPLFLICGPEGIDNGEFEVDLDGWTSSPTGIATRSESTKTEFGEYVMRIEDTGATYAAFARYEIDLLDAGDTLAGHKFLLQFAVYGETAHEMSIRAVSTTETVEMSDVDVTLEQQDVARFFSFSTSSNSTFEIYLFGATGSVATEGIVFVDHVSLREVTFEIDEFVNPNILEWNYLKEIQSRFTTVTGKDIEYPLGWRADLSFNYDYMTALQEQRRTSLSEADYVAVFPHSDCDYCVSCRWVSDFSRRYFGNIFAGYSGVLPFRGIELRIRKPQTFGNPVSNPTNYGLVSAPARTGPVFASGVLHSEAAPKTLSNGDPEIISVVMRQGGIGDVLTMTPALRELRTKFLRSKIYCYVESETKKQVLENNTAIDGVFVFRKSQFIRGRVLDVTESPLWYEAFNTSHMAQSRIDLFAAGCGIAELSTHTLEFNLTVEEKKKAEEYLAARNINREFLIGISPKSSDAYKNWPLEYFDELMSLLQKKDNLSTRFVIFHTDSLSLKNGEQLFQLGFRQQAALLNACSLLVTLDSGFLHLSVPLNIPTLGILGPTRLRTNYKNVQTIHSDQSCSPCWENHNLECNVIHNGIKISKCLFEIQSEQVFEAVLNLQAQLKKKKY